MYHSERPTQKEIRHQVFENLREIAWKWRERRLDHATLGLAVLRARPFFSLERVEQITGIPLQELKESLELYDD